MSVQAITWAYKQPIKPAGLKFILVTLANYASEDGYCYPSQKKLGELTGQSERAVRGHLATLEDRKYIRREARRRGDGVYFSDGFYLLFSQRQILPLIRKREIRKKKRKRSRRIFCVSVSATPSGRRSGGRDGTHDVTAFR